MLEEQDWFLTGSALDALSEQSNLLKFFQYQLRTHFARSEVCLAAFDYIRTPISPVEKKNGWQMAEYAEHENPYIVQHLLGRTQQDTDAVGAEVRDDVSKQLVRDEVILAADETGFIKQGGHSVGVQVQYCGTTGHMENCQVGYF